MRKHMFISGLGVIVLLCLMADLSFARVSKYQQKQNKPLNPKRAILHLFETNDDGSWNLTRGAGRGKLTYRLWGETFDFFFQARRLGPKDNYVLIYIPESQDYSYSSERYAQFNEEWVELGRAMSDRRGRLYMVGSVDTCLMPAAENSSSEVVGHIWLVLESALDLLYDGGDLNLFWELESGKFIAGFHTIRFMDTDGCGDEIIPYYEDPYDEEPEDPAEENPEENQPDEGVTIIGPY